MQFDRRHLRHGEQSILVVDGKVELTAALALEDMAGQVVMPVLLEELLARDAVRAAED